MIAGREARARGARRAARARRSHNGERQGRHRRRPSARGRRRRHQRRRRWRRARWSRAPISSCFVGCRAGSATTEHWRYPGAGQCADRAHRRRPDGDRGQLPRRMRRSLGDAKLALAALLAPSARAHRSARRARTRGPAAAPRAKQAKFAAFEELAASSERPIRPERVVAALQRVLPERRASSSPTLARPAPTSRPIFELRRAGPALHHQPGAWRARLFDVGARSARSSARPGAKVVAVMGDGSFGFACGELETDRAAAAAADDDRLLQRRLRLDQGQPEGAAIGHAISRSISSHRPRARSPRRSASRRGGWRTRASSRRPCAKALDARRPDPGRRDHAAAAGGAAPVSEWVA